MTAVAGAAAATAAVQRHVVVGAGIAGLTLAKRLSEAGAPVCALEREAAVGGLARSFVSGGFTFDVGPHRFHTENPAALALIRDVLGADRLEIARRSGVWMFGRYFDWPLTLGALPRMPGAVLRAVARDLLRRGPARQAVSFDEYILGRYGPTLYEVFFRPYTEKFLKTSCRSVSRDWAVAGIDRAVIDRQLKLDSLARLVASLFAARQPLTFVYPGSGGIGVFAEKLAGSARARGADILCRSPVEALRLRDGRVAAVLAGGTEHRCDQLVWTGPVGTLASLLGLEPPRLRYLDLLLFNYRLRRDSPLRFQWCYFGSADVPFNRISIPCRFNPVLAPPGAAGLCVEVTCMRDDAAWGSPMSADRRIREALVRVGAVQDAADILGVSVEMVPEAYPLSALGYREEFARFAEALRVFGNVRLLGRTGAFQYNNMDNSIEAALALAGELTGAAG